MPIASWGVGEISKKKIEFLNGYRNLDLRIIDVGGGKEKHLPDKFSFVKYIVDIRARDQQLPSTVSYWQGDINSPDVWDEIFAEVERNGKFDVSICTHVLEDLRNPQLVADNLQRISKSGLISVPSVHSEARRFELFGRYRGWRHHRWIHVVNNNNQISEYQVIAVPKISLFENWRFGRLASWRPDLQELWVTWERDFDYTMFQNDHFGRNDYEFAVEYFKIFAGRSPSWLLSRHSHIYFAVREKLARIYHSRG